MAIEVTILMDESTGKVSLAVQKGATFEEAAPKLRALAAHLGIELGPETFKVLGEPERHLHLQEDKAKVQHRTRA